jgi:hypothetical protein
MNEPVSSVPSRVTITDVDMPFVSMVKFILKWTLASIPAILIMVLLGAVLSALFAGVIAGIVGASRL